MHPVLDWESFDGFLGGNDRHSSRHRVQNLDLKSSTRDGRRYEYPAAAKDRLQAVHVPKKFNRWMAKLTVQMLWAVTDD
jgi:hypothetical protein